MEQYSKENTEPIITTTRPRCENCFRFLPI